MEIEVVKKMTVDIEEEYLLDVVAEVLKKEFELSERFMDDKTKEAFKEVYNYYSGKDIENVDRW